VLRKQRRQSAAFVVLSFTAFSGAAVAGAPSAHADVTDGTLTVVVNRDEDGDGHYDEGIDPPQPGIAIAVTDPEGGSVRGLTDAEGRFVVAGSDRLAGGQYVVTAAVPPNLSELSPVTTSETFASFRTSVDLRAGGHTVRMGVASTARTTAASPAPEPTMAPPAVGSDPPRFAVGDKVWHDINRSGRQEAGEPPAAGISVQLLDGNGKVVRSTVSSAAGRFVFDDLAAGTYAVSFAGVPGGFRLTATGSGNDPAADSDPDYTGATPPFTLGEGKPQVRPAAPGDGVRAAFIHADIDAGITSLRYAIGDQVWLDLDADGAQQPGEPPAAATVSLLRDGRVLATTTTDADGRYRFTGLEAGEYRVRFEPGEHRRFTARNATSDPTLDSDADPRTGTTAPITLGPDAAELMPAADLGVTDADLVNATVSAGLVGAYRVGDLVWRDDNGNGVRDSGEPGLPGVRVDLLDADEEIVDRAVTTASGRFAFADLAAGTYRLRFLPPGKNLVFTGARRGNNAAVDSDADSAGLSGPVVLDHDNPADTTVDVGLTSPANLTVVAVSGATTPLPVDTHLSSTGGVAVSIPIAGLALVVSGLSCLVASRRSPLP
jgi:5-hydroxyisourate hydrolase-like protein (transthyretin family)